MPRVDLKNPQWVENASLGTFAARLLKHFCALFKDLSELY
jgi:hypothetical protein